MELRWFLVCKVPLCGQGCWQRGGVSLNPRGYLHVASGEPSPSRSAGGHFHLEHRRCHSQRLAPCCSSFTGCFWKRIFGGSGGRRLQKIPTQDNGQSGIGSSSQMALIQALNMSQSRTGMT